MDLMETSHTDIAMHNHIYSILFCFFTQIKDTIIARQEKKYKAPTASDLGQQSKTKKQEEKEEKGGGNVAVMNRRGGAPRPAPRPHLRWLEDEPSHRACEVPSWFVVAHIHTNFEKCRKVSSNFGCGLN